MAKKKIVFLDVDGELTYSAYENPDTEDIDIEKVKLLKEICNRTGAKVVITSSWRGNEEYTPKCYYTLTNILSHFKIDVLGDAPYVPAEPEHEIDWTKGVTIGELSRTNVKYGTGRAAEVQKYMQDNDVDNFVILDDDDWDCHRYGYGDNWIRPTWYGDGGLKREHVEEAVRLLNHSE